MVRPKVRPPIPQRTPKRYVQTSAPAGASASTRNRSGSWTRANAHGAMIQLKTPPTSQYDSHDHPLTRRYGR